MTLQVVSSHLVVPRLLGYMSIQCFFGDSGLFTLMRSLFPKNRPSGLARALMNLDRIIKTLYLLNYIDDEEYRRHRTLYHLHPGLGPYMTAPYCETRLNYRLHLPFVFLQIYCYHL